MTEPADRVWCVGGLISDAAGVVLDPTRFLTEVRFDEVHRRILFISRVAEQRDFARLLEAVARCERTFDSATGEIAAGGDRARSARRAMALDLVAVSRAADRLEKSLMQVTKNHASPSMIAAFEETWHRARSMPSYLITHERARKLRDGEVEFADSGDHDIAAAAKGILGCLSVLAAASLDAVQADVGACATDIEQLVATVGAGTPTLMSYVPDPEKGFPRQLTMTSLPVNEVAAIRDFYSRQSGLESLVAASFAMAAQSDKTIVEIGDVNVSAALVGLTTSSAVNDMPAASLQLDLDLLGSTPIDYWSAVRFSVMHGGSAPTLFNGAIETAVLDESVASLECLGAIELTEHNLRGMCAAGVGASEVIRAVISQAGLPQDVFPLDGEDARQPPETFEVLVPLVGIEVEQPVRIGSVAIVGRERTEGLLAKFDLVDERAARLAREFESGASYALAEVTAGTLDEAEDAGASAIDTAVSWLVVGGRLGVLDFRTVVSFHSRARKRSAVLEGSALCSYAESSQVGRGSGGRMEAEIHSRAS